MVLSRVMNGGGGGSVAVYVPIMGCHAEMTSADSAKGIIQILTKGREVA